MDAEQLRGLELGLVVVADAAFGDQPGGFVGEAMAPLADAGLRVLMCVLSGLAGVTQVVPAGHGTARSGSVLTPPAAPTKPAAQTAARRGFFKSLLDKLF